MLEGEGPGCRRNPGKIRYMGLNRYFNEEIQRISRLEQLGIDQGVLGDGRAPRLPGRELYELYLPGME